MFTWKRKTKTHLKSFNIHILTYMNTIHQESSTHLYSLGWCSRLPVFSRRVRMQCRIAQSNSPCLCVMWEREKEGEKERESEQCLPWLTGLHSCTFSNHHHYLYLLRPWRKHKTKPNYNRRKKPAGTSYVSSVFLFNSKLIKGLVKTRLR